MKLKPKSVINEEDLSDCLRAMQKRHAGAKQYKGEFAK